MSRQNITVLIAYKLSLHPLSAKILSIDYDQDGKIIIPSHDPISDLLMSDRSHSKSITQIVTLMTSQRRVSPSCGYGIFIYHKRKCFEYCQIAHEYGRSVKSAMECWFAYYDIDKEYDIDTMYREWLRYKRINTYTPKIKDQVSYVSSYADIDKMMAHLVANHVELFYTKRHKFNHSLVAQLRSWCYKKVKGYFPKGVSTRHGYWQLQQWEAFMRQHDDVGQYLTKMLN